MTTYKGINGFGIQYLDSDPANPNIGEVWYNNTTKALKGTTAGGIATGAWSSGNDMIKGRAGGSFFGSLTAAVAVGGETPSAPDRLLVEEYNGTSWSEVNNVPAATLGGGGTGPQTAGVIYGGQNPGNTAVTTEYDGTNWTSGGALNTGRGVGFSGGGSQTAAMYAAGYNSPTYPPGNVSNAEQYNGTSWTNLPTINSARRQGAGGGTTTAMVIAGGAGGSPSTNPTQSETWNGSSWSESSEINTGRGYITGGGSESTSVLIFGGGPPTYAQTEFWNGTSWTEVADMATASETSFGTTQATGTASLRARTPGAGPPGVTEEWTTAATATKTFTVS
jgi:hypothetical protein